MRREKHTKRFWQMRGSELFHNLSLRLHSSLMISSLTGELRKVDEDRVHLKAGPIIYELLVPAADLAELQASQGEELTLHTIFYLAGDVSRGGAEPTLIGFVRADDKRFFNKFTTVKGIGVKTALRASNRATPGSSPASTASASAPPN